MINHLLFCSLVKVSFFDIAGYADDIEPKPEDAYSPGEPFSNCWCKSEVLSGVKTSWSLIQPSDERSCKSFLKSEEANRVENEL